jgi:kinesin family protein 3/17
MERERTQIEEEKAQVDRYKQLLLKQRDIMIALTSRLNERDELDAYERIQKETEQMMESRQARVMQLEDFIREQFGVDPPQPDLMAEDMSGGNMEEPFQVFGTTSGAPGGASG